MWNLYMEILCVVSYQMYNKFYFLTFTLPKLSLCFNCCFLFSPFWLVPLFLPAIIFEISMGYAKGEWLHFCPCLFTPSILCPDWHPWRGPKPVRHLISRKTMFTRYEFRFQEITELQFKDLRIKASSLLSLCF